MVFIALLISAALSVAGTFLIKRRIKIKETTLAALINVVVNVLMLFLLFDGADGLSGISFGKFIVSFTTSLAVELIRAAVYFIKEKRLFLPTCALLALFLSLYAELVVCNFRCFQSAGYDSQTLESPYYGNGLKNVEGDIWIVEKETTATIEYTNLDCEIKNVYADVRAYNTDGTEYSVRITFYADDEANKTSRKLQAIDVLGSIETSKYIKMSLSGKSTTFRMQFSTKGNRIEIGAVKINAPRPYEVNVFRLMSVFLVILVILVMLPGSPLYRIKMSHGKISVRIAAGIAALLVFAVFIGVSATNANFNSNVARHHNQYAELADAFIKNQLWLDKEVPEALINMDNPYDRTERDKVMKEAGTSASWDTAYYNGRYYVYFGVVPVILTFLPYKLITGTDLHCAQSVTFFMFFAVFGVFALIKAIIYRFLDKDRVPLLTYLAVSAATVIGGGFMYLAQFPDLYSTPIIAGAAFLLWGLYFLISAEKDGRMRWYFLLPGSLCMALVAGCRPQMLLFSIALVPIYINEVFKKRTLFSKKSVGATVSLVLPVCMVAFLLMMYNYARFGSPFDFGANYNLTTNDMTRRGFEVDRLGLGLFTYLFQLPKFISVFPFIRSADMDTHYMGTNIYETIYGGALTTTPILWSLTLLFRMKKRVTDKTPVLFSALLCVAALGIIIVDTEGAGLLSRYFSDFRFMMCIAAAIPILFFSADETTEEHGNSAALKGYVTFALISVVFFEFFLLFTRGTMKFASSPNTTFVTFEHFIDFWS